MIMTYGRTFVNNLCTLMLLSPLIMRNVCKLFTSNSLQSISQLAVRWDRQGVNSDSELTACKRAYLGREVMENRFLLQRFIWQLTKYPWNTLNSSRSGQHAIHAGTSSPVFFFFFFSSTPSPSILFVLVTNISLGTLFHSFTCFLLFHLLLRGRRLS